MTFGQGQSSWESQDARCERAFQGSWKGLSSFAHRSRVSITCQSKSPGSESRLGGVTAATFLPRLGGEKIKVSGHSSLVTRHWPFFAKKRNRNEPVLQQVAWLGIQRGQIDAQLDSCIL